MITIENCPLRKSMEVLSGKWTMIVLKNISKDELRFGEIKKKIPDISEKVLIAKLKDLCDAEMVYRKDFQEVPPRVSYRLTPKGLDALQVVKQAEAFGKKYS